LNAQYTFAAHGQEVTLLVKSERLRLLARDLHSCAQVRNPTEGASADIVWEEEEFRISLNGEPWGIEETEAALFLQSENLVTQLLLSRFPNWTQIHAAGVVSPGGKGLMICGPSGAGKTSLTLALLRKEWSWISDEFVFISNADAQTFSGLKRNFNLKERSFLDFPETAGKLHTREFYSNVRRCRIRFFDPEVVFPRRQAANALLTGLVFPCYDPEASSPVLRRKSPLETINALLGEVALAQSWTPAWISATASLVPAFELKYRSPDKAAALLPSEAQ
jgi:hypothetical protein